MADKKKVKYRLRVIPKERRRQYNTKSRKITLGLLVFFAVVIAVFSFMKSDHFNIDKITVDGNVKLTYNEIVDVSGIKTGENIFDYNTSKARKAVMSLSYVDSVEIVRDYPSEVYIYVKEKAGTMALLTNSVYYYLDSEGVVLKSTGTLTDTDVMIVSFAEDMQEAVYEVGQKVDYSADPRLGIAEKIYEFAKDNDLTAYISEFYVSANGVNYIYTTKSNVIKFYTYAAFEQNLDFVKEFILYEDRHIMAEVVEETRPVYKIIEIE